MGMMNPEGLGNAGVSDLLDARSRTLRDPGMATDDFEGECIANVRFDLRARPRPKSQVIVFANEKGGVGKSTLAFHTAIALLRQGLGVAVLDLDLRQQSTGQILGQREVVARRLGHAVIPVPRWAVLRQQTGAMLVQEALRVGGDCDVIIIDVAGADSRIARRAIALADLLVSPIGGSVIDLAVIGRTDPVSGAFVAPGQFAALVHEIDAIRADLARPPIAWWLVPNRIPPRPTRNQTRIERTLAELAGPLRFRVAPGLVDRVIYRELAFLGLTVSDLGHVPDLPRYSPQAETELAAMIAALPIVQGVGQDQPSAVARPAARSPITR